ncbi:MAG: hypothetical protein GX100_05535 [candidate division WS1 bacterium]|nr:hypothetical protein [candidate division WS1 bacterium]
MSRADALDLSVPGPAPIRRLPRWALPVALALAVAIALVGFPTLYYYNPTACNYFPVFDPATQQLYASNPDALAIVEGAQEAETRGVGRWWTGNWIQATSRFYRPLSSLLMYTEYRLWGTEFQKYCVVSWLVHALNAALLCLLVFRLTRQAGDWSALGIGLLAVVLFNLRRGVVGPGWLPECVGPQQLEIPMRIARAELPYWPAQTDLLSLACSLGSLLLFDSYARRGRCRHLAGAVLVYILALLFKEMALVVALLGPLVVWYRRRRIPWRLGALTVGLALLLLLIRELVVPGAQNPSFRSLWDVAQQVLWYLHWRLQMVALAGVWWHVWAGAGMVSLLYLARRFRLSIVFAVPALLVWPVLMASLVGGNPGLTIVNTQAANAGLAFLFSGGLFVLARGRESLAWMLAVMLLVVHLPILHLQGPHYLYWPAAFWGMLDAVLVWQAARQWQKL